MGKKKITISALVASMLIAYLIFLSFTNEKQVATQFLEVHYTSNLAQIPIEPEERMEYISQKYGDLITEKELLRLTANRVAMETEIDTAKTGVTMTIKSIELQNQTKTKYGETIYDFKVIATIEAPTSQEKTAELNGEITLKKESGKWKVYRFTKTYDSLESVFQN